MLKLLVEFGPIIVFFGTYKFSDIFIATLLMLLVTAVGLVISYIIDRKISMPLLISGTVLLISGLVTLISGNPKYIKMKPTIVYAIFGAILMAGVIKRQGLIRHVFATVIKMREEAWLTLSKRFAGYFFSMAVINEMVWRNYSEDFWVNFKVFGFVPLTLLFVLSQSRFIYLNQQEFKEKDNAS